MKTKTRKQIQAALQPAVANTLAELRMPRDTAHARRSCRALMRIAADRAQRKGCSLQEFHALANEAFLKESIVEIDGLAMIFVSDKAKA